MKPPTRRGFGSRAIEQVLAKEIERTVSVRYAPSGLQCFIEAPFSDAVVALA